jgi:hypothetical protein
MSTEIETTTAITTPIDAQKALAAKLPPAYRDRVMLLQRPTASSLIEEVSKLPEEFQERVRGLVLKANPNKPGAHTSRSRFSPTPIRLYHGTGKDDARPKNTIPGQFYTKTSTVLGEEFTGLVFNFFEGRILWPSRDGSSVSNNPICVSFDREVGSNKSRMTAGGKCAECPKAKEKYNAGGCMKEVTFYVIDKDFTDIYEVKFNKSSVSYGEKLADALKRSENIWDRWVTFESVERTRGDVRWFEMQARPVANPKNPADNFTPKELHRTLQMFCDMLDADVYYPSLAASYSKPAEDEGGTTLDATASDLDAVAKVSGGAAPDYSTTDI